MKLHPVNCEALKLFFASCDGKLNFFGFWMDG